MGQWKWDSTLSNKSQQYTFKVSYAETDINTWKNDDITAKVMALWEACLLRKEPIMFYLQGQSSYKIMPAPFDTSWVFLIEWRTNLSERLSDSLWCH